MKIKKSPRCLFLLAIMQSYIFSLTAQTSIGPEGAICNDFNRISDNGNQLKRNYSGTELWGLMVSTDFRNKNFIESGLLIKNYDLSFSFKSIENYGGYTFKTVLWPIRIGIRINLRKEKLYLVPVAGLTFGMNLNYNGSGRGGVNIRTNTDSATYNYSTSDRAHFFPLLQTGMGVEYKFLKYFTASFMCNYYTGYTNFVIMDLQYSTNNSALTNGRSYCNGSFLSYGLSLKYRISELSIFQKRNL